MAVETQEQEVDGYGDSMNAFVTSHNSNTAQLLNVSEGKKKNAPRPPYNADHPDNQWPVMLYHPQHGEMIVGKSLVSKPDPAKPGAFIPITEPQEKAIISKRNEAEKAALLKQGWRPEPYQKPRAVVLDPVAEKAALVRQNQELQGQITATNDMVAKLQEKIDALLAKQ